MKYSGRICTMSEGNESDVKMWQKSDLRGSDVRDRGWVGENCHLDAAGMSEQWVPRPDICHFFSTNVLLGSIFLHMKIA